MLQVVDKQTLTHLTISAMLLNGDLKKPAKGGLRQYGLAAGHGLGGCLSERIKRAETRK